MLRVYARIAVYNRRTMLAAAASSQMDFYTSDRANSPRFPSILLIFERWRPKLDAAFSLRTTIAKNASQIGSVLCLFKTSRWNPIVKLVVFISQREKKQTQVASDITILRSKYIVFWETFNLILNKRDISD